MKMDEVFGKIASEKIAVLEEQYGFHLPQDYRDFLLSVGGGAASTLDEENSIPLEELHDGLDIGVLYGIGNATRASTIEHWMGKYWDEIWEHSVLIGDTQGGSFYVLMCEGEDTGVWFWDDCWEYEATNEKKNTYFVAKSFTEFINLLGGKLELPDGRVWKPTEA